MMKKMVLALLLVCSSFVADAQQNALFSQYIFNLFVVNPAYAGTREALSLTGSYRAQWVGFEGAPTTQNVGINGPLRKQNMGLGFQFQNDVIGARRATSIGGTYSYMIKLGRKKKLSFGLQANLMNYHIDWEKLSYGEQGDPVGYSVNANRYIPNFDFGVMYLAPNAYVGASAYNLYNAELNDIPLSDARLQQHFQIMGGKVFDLSKNLSLKPGFLGRYTLLGPYQFDLSLGALFVNKIWLTTTYRYQSGMVFSTHFFATEKFHIGYSYDWTSSNIGTFQSGSHELFLGYDFAILAAKSRKRNYF